MDPFLPAKRYFQEISATSIHYLSLDCVVFGFHHNELKVLLLRWKDTEEWSLPGGFIGKRESVDAAAIRVLQERTGLEHLFLQQFHVFGAAERYDQDDTWARTKLGWDPESWSERTISLGYYALVDYTKVTPMPDLLSDECRWWAVDQLPRLLFDHNHIIEVALKTLRRQLSWQPVGYNLLPDKFTLPELQRLYETILGRPLDPRNFHKKMMGLNILERLEERRRGGAYKSPYLYRFRPEAYEQALEEGAMAFG